MRTDFLKDRLTQGFIAGVAGWPLQIIFTGTLFKFHLTKLRFLDFAAVLTFNHKLNGGRKFYLLKWW